MTGSLITLDALKEVAVPLMRPCKFAELTGISPSNVRAMLDNESLPAVTLPKEGAKRPTRYVNLVALYKHCSKEGELWSN